MNRISGMIIKLIFAFGLVLWIPNSTKAALISWNHVNGASRYRVEVLNAQGVLIIDLETRLAYVDLPLLPGWYSLRVSVYNRFNKLDAIGTWTPLRVEAPKKPEISGFTPSEFILGEGDQTLRLEGGELQKALGLRLVGTNGRFELKIKHRSNESIEGELPSWGFRPGLYTLELYDHEKTLGEKDGLLIGEAKPLLVTDVKPQTIDIGSDSDLTVSGSGFGPRIELLVFNDDHQERFELPVDNGSLSLSLSTEKMPAGSYRLRLKRIDGQELTSPGFEILSPDLADSQEKPPRVLKPWYVGFSSGYLASESEQQNYDFTTAFDFGVFLGRRFGSVFSGELSFRGRELGFSDNQGSGLTYNRISVVSLGVDLAWAPDFGSFLNPWLSTGFGFSNTIIDVDNPSYGVDHYSSWNPNVNFSLGLRLVFFESVYLDLGGRFEWLANPDSAILVFGPIARLAIGFGSDEDPKQEEDPAEMEEDLSFYGGLHLALINFKTSWLAFEPTVGYEIFLGYKLGDSFNIELGFDICLPKMEVSSWGGRGDTRLMGFSFSASWVPDLGFFIRPVLGFRLGGKITDAIITNSLGQEFESESSDLSFGLSGMLRFELLSWLWLDLGYQVQTIRLLNGNADHLGPFLRVAFAF